MAALRLCSRRFSYRLVTQPSFSPICIRTAATATASSNLPDDFKHAIEVSLAFERHQDELRLTTSQREASLTNADPPSDSQTAHLVNDQLPFMVPTYVRPPPMFTKGEGCYLWDVENRSYLDFTAGIAVNALGHCDPEMTKLMYQQVSYYHPTTEVPSVILSLDRLALLSTPPTFTIILGRAHFPNFLWKRPKSLEL